MSRTGGIERQMRDQLASSERQNAPQRIWRSAHVCQSPHGARPVPEQPHRGAPFLADAGLEGRAPHG